MNADKNRQKSPMNLFKQIVIVLMVMVVATSCTSNSGELEVQNVWSRSSPSVAQNGVFYMTIINNSNQNDLLLSVQTEACGAAELHEIVMQENGLMGMRPVERGVVEVLAGEMVELKTGGLHVMCLDKQIEFEAGVEIPLTLFFEQAGEVAVTAVVRDS